MKLLMRRNIQPTVAGRLILFVVYFPPFISMLWRECWRHAEYFKTRVEFGTLINERCLEIEKHQNYFGLNSAIKLLCNMIGSEAHISSALDTPHVPSLFRIYFLAFIPSDFLNKRKTKSWYMSTAWLKYNYNQPHVPPPPPRPCFRCADNRQSSWPANRLCKG